MGVESLSVVADRGYFKSEEILACHEAGITAFVPKAKTSAAAAAGRFGRDDFIYDAAHNEYRCPAGERLIWRFATVEKGLKLHRYSAFQSFSTRLLPPLVCTMSFVCGFL